MADEPESDRVRAALEELLGWEDLHRSPQLAEFLKYIVESKLAGDEANIKAYAIAVDVFGRPVDFDPQTDPIVRVQGGRLRGLLNRFYDERLNAVPVRIRIPVGRYVPEFEALQPPEEPAAEETGATGAADTTGERTGTASRSRRRRVRETGGAAGGASRFGLGSRKLQRRLALVAAVLAFAAILTWVVVSVWMPLDGQEEAPTEPVPTEPSISIGTFTNLTGVASLDEPVSGLGLQLVTDLSRFAELTVRNAEPGDGEGEAGGAEDRAYELSGVVRRGTFGVEFNMLLTNRSNREVVWTNSMSEPSLVGDYQLLIGRISRLAAGALGSHRSPIHADQRQWVIRNGEDLPAVSEYICRLAHGVARDEPSRQNRDAARDCFQRMLDEAMAPVIARAGLAGIAALDAYAEAPPDESRAVLLADALAEARAAAEAVPYSSFVRSQLGRVLHLSGDWENARHEYVAAVQRNPADSDLRGEFALMLAIGGEWQAGQAQMELAFASAPTPPSWFYLLDTMKNMVDGDFEAAFSTARSVISGNDQWGKVLGTAAAALSGHPQTVEELSPQLLENEHYQAYGIVPWMQRYIGDPALAEAVARGLEAADLPPKIIYGPPGAPDAAPEAVSPLR